VPEAETKIHHIFLRETARLAERANAPPECLAESWEVQGHRTATLCGSGHRDHGPKCRKHSQGLRRSPNRATMVRMGKRLCVVLSCLLVASLGGCSSGSQTTSHPDASAVTGGSGGSAGTGGGPGGVGRGSGGTGGQLSTATSATPPLCVPGASVACACVTGQQGAQTCTAAGTFAACVCAASAADAGRLGGAGGTSPPLSSGGTGGPDAGPPDASTMGKADSQPTAQADVSAPERGKERGTESGREPVAELTPEPVPEPGPDVTDAGTGNAPESGAGDAPSDSPSVQGWVDRTDQAAGSAGLWPMAYPYQQYGPLVFDAHRNKTVMFCSLNLVTLGILAPICQALEWDGVGGTWVTRNWTAGVNSPASRSKFAVAYDAARGKVILSGGTVGGTYPNGETWEWDGDTGTWTGRGNVSPGRWKHAMAYDESTGRVVLFGGVATGPDSSAIFNDLWEYDGAAGTWTNRTPYPLPASWPQARMDHAMAYDPSRGKTVLCGGVTEANAGLDEMWDWDSTQGTWTNRTPSPLPTDRPGRCPSNGFAYSGNGMMAVFTGNSVTGNFYRWNGISGTWTNMTPSPLPTAWPPLNSSRVFLALAWDSTRSRLVLIGGIVALNTNPQYGLDDTWEWVGP
jgi:hypothetical protein